MTRETQWTREHAKAEVGPGWAALVDECYDYLEKSGLRYTIAQVKEKFGALRIYVDWRGRCCPQRQRAEEFLWDAEIRSLQVCDVCGEPGRARSFGYLVKTVCDPCAVAFAVVHGAPGPPCEYHDWKNPIEAFLHATKEEAGIPDEQKS